MAIATDANVFFKELDSSLFPGVSSSVKVHSGFANEQAKWVYSFKTTWSLMKLYRTAADILSAVQTAISQTSITTVTVVGHSLGGAIALIDSIYLLLHTTGVTIQAIVYGCPRVCFISYDLIFSTDGTYHIYIYIGRQSSFC